MHLEKEKEILRSLAFELTELAMLPENEKKKKRWADHNELQKQPGRLLWICPDDDGGWLELVPEKDLKCYDSEYRSAERMLRQQIYQAMHFQDDFVFEPRLDFVMPGQYTGYLYGNKRQETAWGISIKKPKIGEKAYHLDSFLNTDEDYEKLLNHQVDFIPDVKEYERMKEKMEETFKGVLDIEFHVPYSVLVQSHLIELVHLRGLENLMYDVYDEPELLQKVLYHMGESKAQLLKRLEENKLLFDNRSNIYTGSGGLGYTYAKRKKQNEVTLKDMWGFADAQEFSSVSPKMFEEFALKNQKIGLNLFGLGCYGCCEPMDGKYTAAFAHIHNLRRISVSPWANLEEAAECIGNKAVFSWKPDPSKVCMGFDESKMRSYLKWVKQTTRDCYMEIILKDIRTCGGTDRWLVKFAELVKEIF